MRIPDNTLRNSLIGTYGVDGLESDEIELPYGGGCPLVYRVKYVEQAMPEMSWYAADYGSLIHDAMFAAEEDGIPLFPDALEKAWARVTDPTTGEHLRTLGPEAYQEAVDDLTAYMERGSLELATVAVEQELTMPLLTFDGTEFLFGGRLDMLAIDPSEEEISTIYVVDYKTDRQPPSKEKVATLPQGTGYCALARANLHRWLPDVDPEGVEFVFVYDAIKWYALPSPREHFQMDSWTDWAAAVARKILQDQEGYPILNEDCGGCPLKFDCPEFAKLPGMGETLAARLSETTDLTQRILLMQEAKAVMSGLKGLVEDVQVEIKAAARTEPIVLNGMEYSLADAFETDWEPVALHRMLGPKFYEVVNVVAGKVDEMIKRDANLKEGVEQCRTKVAKGKKLSAKKKKS